MNRRSFSTKIGHHLKRWCAEIDHEALASSLFAVSGFYGAPIVYRPNELYVGEQVNEPATASSATTATNQSAARPESQRATHGVALWRGDAARAALKNSRASSA